MLSEFGIRSVYVDVFVACIVDNETRRGGDWMRPGSRAIQVHVLLLLALRSRWNFGERVPSLGTVEGWSWNGQAKANVVLEVAPKEAYNVGDDFLENEITKYEKRNETSYQDQVPSRLSCLLPWWKEPFTWTG